MKNLCKTLVLLCVMLGFAACNNDGGESVYSIADAPAVLDSVGEHPVIRTAYGKYSVPALANTSIEKGSLLWVNFVVDKKDQPNKEVPVVQDFKYTKIDSTKVTIPADTTAFKAYLSDSYSDSIDVAMLYNTYIDEMLFFQFAKKAADNQKFTYELICNPTMETNENIPTLYIRAKKDGGAVASTATSSGGKSTIFGFKMSDYIAYYKTKSSGVIKFNLKYKTGTDKDGKDVYKEFKNNPISWDVK